MTTGAEAKAYADHFILVHMNAAGNGQTYEEVSGQYIALTKNPAADPAEVKALSDLRQTLFMGNALRGMLLNSYAVGTIGAIAMWGAVVSAFGSLVLFVLTGLGRWHMKRCLKGRTSCWATRLSSPHSSEESRMPRRCTHRRVRRCAVG